MPCRPGIRSFRHPLFQREGEHLLSKIARRAYKRNDTEGDELIRTFKRREEQLIASCQILEEKTRACEERFCALQLENERLKRQLQILSSVADGIPGLIGSPLTSYRIASSGPIHRYKLG